SGCTAGKTGSRLGGEDLGNFHMKILFHRNFSGPVFLLMCCFTFSVQAQFMIPSSSLFYGLKAGDSVTVYQCRVTDPSSNTEESDYAPAAPYTITEKVVVKRHGENYSATVYTTHIRDLPNRKF